MGAAGFEPATSRVRSERSPTELRVDSLELGDYRYLHSTRAELLRRLGRQEEARAAFEHAVRLAATDPERRFLARRLAGL
jgi:RNA polymerase sigma-70 factor, ECF subfamily